MLLAHFALQLLCITFNAPTNSQSGIADMCRPPVNHIKPPLGEPSSSFVNPSYAPRQYDPHGLSALSLLCRHERSSRCWRAHGSRQHRAHCRACSCCFTVMLGRAGPAPPNAASSSSSRLASFWHRSSWRCRASALTLHPKIHVADALRAPGQLCCP